LKFRASCPACSGTNDEKHLIACGSIQQHCQPIEKLTGETFMVEEWEKP